MRRYVIYEVAANALKEFQNQVKHLEYIHEYYRYIMHSVDFISFVLFNNDAEPKAKKTRTKGPNQKNISTLLLKVTVTTDYSMCKINAIWMNAADIARHWQKETSRLVNIGNRLFTVLEMATLPQGTVLLNYIQNKQIQHSKFSFQGTDHIVATPAHKPLAQYKGASKLEIKFEPIDNIGKPIISLDYLRGKMKTLFRGQVLSHLQEYYFEKNEFKFKVTVYFPENDHLDTYKRLTSKTIIEFITNSNPIIYNKTEKEGPESERTANFEITSFKPSKVENCLVDVDDLKAKIAETIRKAKYHIEGMGINVKTEVGHSLTLNLEEDQPAEAENEYKTLFQLDEMSTFDVNVQASAELDKQIQLYSGIRVASKMEFTISHQEPDDHPEDEDAWVSAEKLTEFVKNFPGFMQDLKFYKEICNYPLKFKVTNITATLFSEEIPFPPMTQIDDKTELKFVSKYNTLTIVDDDLIRKISHLTLIIKKMSKEDGKQVTLVKEKLEKKCRDALSSPILPKHTLSFYDEQDKQNKRKIHVEVGEMKFVEAPIPEYGSFGKLTDETKIVFKTSSKENLEASSGVDLEASSEENLEIITQKELDSRTDAIDFSQLEKVVGGVAEQLKEIIRKVSLSRGIYKEEFKKRGLKPIKGMLLYGPPGTGKTTLARNIGQVFGCKGDRFQLITGPELTHELVGVTERKIRELFKPAEIAQKRDGENSELYMIVMDECESLLSKRQANSHSPWMNSQVNQFLGKIDGLNQLDNVFVILMSNRKDIIDPAILRPGRIELHLELNLADQEGRKQIFNIHTKTMKEANLLQDVDINKLAEMTVGLTGAEIEGIVKDASAYSLERMNKLKLTKEQAATHEAGKVTMKDFEVAVQTYFAKHKT